jgi:hypothetical protein
MKYFYYISKDKVEMLLSQIQYRSFWMSNLRKIQIAGFGFGAEAENNNNRNIFQKALVLKKRLEKTRKLMDLDEIPLLNTECFFLDHNPWRSGLFSFSGGDYYSKVGVATYLLWRAYYGSIILLIGSPSNILGEKIVRDGISIPGSVGAMEQVVRFVQDLVKLNGESLAALPGHKPYFFSKVSKTEIDFEAKEVRPNPFLYASAYLSPNPNPVRLGLFCLEYLNNLPESRIETIFKIFKVLNIDHNQRGLSNHVHLRKFNRICIGSPIYTTIG